MSIYAIGDLQGCFVELQRLLDRIAFDPTRDRLWFVGDLVNRGPDSLATLRFVKSLGEAAVTVLGNHDLHLLAVSLGAEPRRSKDTFQDVLHAEDADELLHWLRHLPLMHYDVALDVAMVHAGLPPQWDLVTALGCAREVESALRGEGYKRFFTEMYGNKPALWSPALTGYDRLRYCVNAFTRMRYCDPAGQLDFKHKLGPGNQPLHLLPWFRIPWRRLKGTRIVFGHWSTLGFHDRDNVYAIDTGCVWGGYLTALRLDAEVAEPVAVPCKGAARPDEG